MALRDVLRGLIGNTHPVYRDVTFTESNVAAVLGMSVEDLWRTQPHLRTVVSFVARNIAQLGLHSFERVSEADRRRLRQDPVPQTLGRPNPSMTSHELVYSLVADYKLYDVAIWLLVETTDAASGWEIYPVSPSWVRRTGGGTAWAPAWIEIQRPGALYPTRVDAENFLLFHGWNPGNPAGWSSPVDALRGVLAEQIHANAYRQQVWQRGGRVGTVLTRPAGTSWSDAARERFARDWAAKWTGIDGPKAGGTPILEDGMDLKRIGFSAKEDEWIEGAKLSLSTVASVYHINPTMVGVLDNANFSNVREFRRMLYGDSLGPDLAMIEDRINTFLVPRLTSREDVYVEFNIGEKMQGSFEEQAAVISTSVGRPWMTADEARSRFNMPALGGDAEALVTPLNVLVGGQASPRDGVTAGGGASAALTGDDLKQRVDAAAALIRSGFDPAGALEAVGLDPITHLGLLPVTVQKPLEPTEPVDDSIVDAITDAPKARKSVSLTRASASGPLKVKAAVREQDTAAAAQVLSRFFKRQRGVVLSRLGAKAPEWWDADRWDDELADDLYALAMTVSKEIADETLDALGVEPDAYSPERTAEFLRAVAKSRAGAINSTTRDKITAALAGDVGDDAVTSSASGVFDEAESSRAEQGGTTLATTLAAFAVTEVGKQMGRPSTTKTWIVESSKPRASHASMNGETVGIEETFSNGMAWPGDPAGGADEVAGCMCGVELTIP